MSRNGLLIDYEYCTGCHSCEVACRNEKNIPREKWGIKLTEVGPWNVEGDKWEWNYIACPTELCDLCGDRVARGEKPACALHCLGQCMEVGPIEELVEKMEAKGKKMALFVP